jgi:hypothetical protein
MKPTLFVLAAGMGSRYGGLKQLDGVGPHGETIMDYSIYDAIKAGFGKVAFVIRKDFEQDFREKVLSKYEGHVPVEVVFQSIDALPEGYTCPADRAKPWGTNHAVLMGKDAIKEPFAVINADDFYGRNAFEVIAAELSREHDRNGDYCMVGFRVGNTMTENGSVARGVCSTSEEGFLTKITDVVGVKIGDAPGKLAGALKVLGENKINMEYLYAFMARTEKHAYVVIRVEDNNKAETALESAGYHIITDADIAKLCANS